MRRAIFIAAEAWRQYYGQMATGKNENPDAKLDFKIPSTGQIVTLPGYTAKVQKGQDGDYTIYVGPNGEQYDNLQYAYEAMKEARCNTAEKTSAIDSLRHLLKDFTESYSARICLG